MATTARKKAAPKQLTTAQRLDNIIKSARKIMRKDKGLNGDLDRLPMLTWIMFLKFLDDMERIEEGRAELAGKDYRSIIDAPYRWRDWAADADGITGPDLLSFLVAEMTERPDSTRGPGLFAYLRALRGDNGRRERRDVIATVFQGFANRMESGYLLRDVVNHRRHPFRLLRRSSHPRPPLRDAAARDARRRGGFGRVLYAPTGCALHGRGDEPETR